MAEQEEYFPKGILKLDGEGNILSWNREAEAIIEENIFKGKSMKSLGFHCLGARGFNITEKLEETGGFTSIMDIEPVPGHTIPVLIQGLRLPQSEEARYVLGITDLRGALSGTPLAQDTEDSGAEGFENIIGRDKRMQELYKMIRQAADSVANVFIYGESGTGKELVARAIHNLSDRRENPFIAVNCSALSESLLESELFGHAKGAFTGAVKEKIGKFEAAHKGTIFLDEIGDISPPIQLKLLRVIQEKIIVRVGDNKEIKVDMRIITATNKEIRKLVNEGDFREDLFYRLKVFSITTIPLREREGDIPLLCRHMIKNFNRQTGKKIQDLTNNAYRMFMDYCWPGNVRELENAIEYAFVVCTNAMIDVFDLPVELRSHNLRKEYCRRFNAGQTLAEDEKKVTAIDAESREKQKLLDLLEKNKGNKTKTAEELGISRVGLWKKMKRWGIE